MILYIIHSYMSVVYYCIVTCMYACMLHILTVYNQLVIIKYIQNVHKDILVVCDI